jgi:hypothetical protein
MKLRVYPEAAGGGGDKDKYWDKWNLTIVKSLLRNYELKQHLPDYISFCGWDEHLQFDRSIFSDDFGLRNQLYLLSPHPEVSHHDSVTMKVTDQTFVIVKSNGDYKGLMDPVWAEKTKGNYESMVQVVMDKMRWGHTY